MKRVAIWIIGLLLASMTTAQTVAQKVTLTEGWNAFWLGVAIDGQSADEVFADWPTDSVSMYRADEFLKSEQYVNSATEAVLPKQPFAVWTRGYEAESTLRRVAGDAVYVLKATTPYEVILKGRPVGRRMDWHSEAQGANYFGVSVPSGVSVPPSDYLAGLDPLPETIYRLGGTSAVPATLPLLGSQNVRLGDVLIFPRQNPSDWNGAFEASPRYGVDFGEGGTVASMTFRNNSDKAQELRLTQAGGDAVTPPALSLMYRDADLMAATTNEWFSLDVMLTKTLEPGATWSLQLGLDRTKLGLSGTNLCDILICTDTGSSRHSEMLPVMARDLSTRAGRWPEGIWTLNADLETVTRVVGSEDLREGLKAHRAMPVRLLMQVDGDGHMTLLQRITAVSVPGTSAGTKTIVYGPKAMPDTADAVFARLSSPVLPTDFPEIPLEGTFATSASGEWTLAPQSSSNPFRHPFHPDHDGKRADYLSDAPDGDVIANYTQPVKPELWSVGNTLSLRWDAKLSLAWQPTETLTGTLVWKMTGLRAEGPITVSGPFAMRRIIAVPDYRKE